MAAAAAIAIPEQAPAAREPEREPASWLDQPYISKSAFQWTRGFVLVLAQPGCAHCHGLGAVIARQQSWRPCNCVLRAAFRACWARWRGIAMQHPAMHSSQAFLAYAQTGRQCKRAFGWGRPQEEYLADVLLVARRTLSSAEWRCFELHWLQEKAWRYCCPRLGHDRGSFFHECYRIEQKLGRAFVELQPYPLYPPGDYFSPVLRQDRTC